MKTIKYTWWQDGQFFLGFMNEYSDYLTQAYSKDELLENLKSLLEDIESGEVPYIRKTEEMRVEGTLPVFGWFPISELGTTIVNFQKEIL